MADSTSALGAFAAFCASVTWAFASTRYSDAARDAGPVRVNLLRALVACTFWSASLLLIAGPRSLSMISVRHVFLLTASMACSYAFGDGLFFRAAARLGPSSALAIAAIYPLWAALYGALFRGEPFGPLRALGVLCCLSGVSALLRLGQRGHASARGNGATVGVLLALLTSLCWAGNAVLLKVGAEGLTLLQASALRFTLGAALLLVQLPLAEKPKQPAPLLPLAKRIALALVADTVLGSLCFLYGLAHTDLALGATLSSLSPLVVLPIAAIQGSERMSWAKIVAVFLTVLGVGLLVGMTPG